jgi:hypothetical protein
MAADGPAAPGVTSGMAEEPPLEADPLIKAVVAPLMGGAPQ